MSCAQSSSPDASSAKRDSPLRDGLRDASWLAGILQTVVRDRLGHSSKRVTKHRGT